MKVKIKTPDTFALGFSRAELDIIGNCLGEATHGEFQKQFAPVRTELLKLRAETLAIVESIKPAAIT